MARRPPTSDGDCDEAFAPRNRRADVGRALDRRPYAALVEHDVHSMLVPEGRENPAADAERGAAVMILLDGLG